MVLFKLIFSLGHDAKDHLRCTQSSPIGAWCYDGVLLKMPQHVDQCLATAEASDKSG